MKKIVIIGLLLFMTGCSVENISEVGIYKEGTYVGSYVVDTEEYTSFAVLNVGANGKIESIYIDTVYPNGDVYSTKKIIGDDYGMKSNSANNGVIEGGAEWYEQVNNLEVKIVEEQGLDWLEFNDDELTTDSVSGVTIKVNGLYEAVNNALSQAK